MRPPRSTACDRSRTGSSRVRPSCCPRSSSSSGCSRRRGTCRIQQGDRLPRPAAGRHYAPTTMKILDRFTRDRLSRYIWGGFTIVFLFGIVWAAQRQRDALQQARLDAQARAVHYVQTTLFDNLDAKTVAAPILAQNYRNLIIPVTAEIFTDPAVARLRIWSPTGELLFSSAERDLIGEATAAGNPAIQNAVQSGEVTSTLTKTTVAPKQGLEGSPEQLYQTFVPLQVPDR